MEYPEKKRYDEDKMKGRKEVGMKRIDSTKNDQIKQWKKLHKKRGRENEQQFIIEGYHLIEEALNAGIKLEALLFTEDAKVPERWTIDERRMIVTNSTVLNELCETETPQGIAAICELPTQKEWNVTKGRFLLIDRVQDPGNLGTLIRTADACGLDGVILEKGSADIYNSKVIRASQGSIFHLPITKGELKDWVTLMKQAKIPVFGTALEKASTYTAIEPQSSFALILGNEGEGVSKELLELTDQNLYIPILGQAESLNVSVAAGILLYHLRSS